MKKLLLAIGLVLGLMNFSYAAGPYVETQILTGSNIIGAVKPDKINYTVFNKWASDSTIQTRATLWTPTSGTKAVITDIILSTDTALRFDLLDASTATVFSPFYVAANSTANIHLTTPIKSAAVDNVITYSTNVDGGFSIQLLGYEE